MDEITDPRNIGSIIRSARSFNIDGIIIKERSFPSDSKLMYKSASGAVENIEIFEVPNINTTLKYLRENNFWVYGFDSNLNKKFHRDKMVWKYSFIIWIRGLWYKNAYEKNILISW